MRLITNISLVFLLVSCTNVYQQQLENSSRIESTKVKRLKVDRKNDLDKVIIDYPQLEVLILDSLNLDSLPPSIIKLDN